MKWERDLDDDNKRWYYFCSIGDLSFWIEWYLVGYKVEVTKTLGGIPWQLIATGFETAEAAIKWVESAFE